MRLIGDFFQTDCYKKVKEKVEKVKKMRSKRKIATSVMAVALSFSMAGGMVMGTTIPAMAQNVTGQTTGETKQEMEVTKLPELTFENYQKINEEQMAKYVTKDNTIPMLWQGLLEQSIKVGDTTRTIKMYVPKDTKQGSMFVIMNVPEGQDTLTFMKNSGWMEKADEEGFGLFVLEPGKSGWGNAKEELAYVKAAVGEEMAGTYCMAGPSFYAVGYGAVGSALHEVVMAQPLQTAGAVFFDASDVDSDYLAQYKEKSFNVEGKTYDVNYKDVPVPVMMASKELTAQAQATKDYWTEASKNIKNYNYENLDVTPVVKNTTYDYNEKATTQDAWKFLSQYYRYGGGPVSNHISKKVDYKTRKVDFKHFTDSNGIDREYLVYVPEKYKNKKNLPVVIAYHGASTSATNFFENSLWYEKAEQEGFMVVFPESTLVVLPPTLNGGVARMYRPLWQVENPDLRATDITYADEMLNKIKAEYPVDASRIYCTGHSMGSMMTNYLGSSFVGENFAAIGATSGPMMAKDETLKTTLPMWQTMAEYDMWPYSLDENASGMLVNAANYWLVQNGLATQENVTDIRAKAATKTYVDGRYNTSEWANEKGQVLYRYSWVTKKDHVNLPAENFKLWDEWFSKWSLEEKGRAYNGTIIGEDPKPEEPVVKVKKATIQKVKAGKKKVTVTLKKDKTANGYQVLVSSSPKFAKGKVKTITVNKNSKTTVTVVKLKKGTYYIKARAFVNKDGKKTYGAYSKVSKAKVKK